MNPQRNMRWVEQISTEWMEYFERTEKIEEGLMGKNGTRIQF